MHDTKPLESTEPLTTSQPELETSLNVMDNSIMSLQNMVILMSDRHPEKGLYLDNLAGALHARFKLLGNIKDLQDAISNQRKCLGITPDQDLNKPWLFSNLAGLLWDRFIHVGELEDLEEAIHGMQGAHRVLSDRYSGHPDSDGKLASSYANLGAVFLERHLRLRVFKDLEVAIQNLEMAVQLGSKVLNPDYRHIQSGFLTDLGTAFEARFDRLNALEDIDMAVSTQKQAAEILHDSDEKKQTRLSNLANALWKRFERLREPTDLESSIFYHLQAVQLTPDHNPSKPTSLNSLAGIFMERFGINGALEDLESAISNQEKAVQLTKAYDPTKTEHLMNLSEVLKERFKRLKDPKNLRDALSNAEQAANHPPGFPRPRFQAALIWAECAKLSSISPIPAFQLAINLLLRIAWLGIPITDQHALLAQLGDAVCDAVAAAINHYDYETAVEWAEQGRSIVWQNLLSLRTPLEILQVDHPKIAKQLQDISKQLETPSSSHHSIDVTQASPVSDIGQTYLHLSMERDGLIEKIRLIPGFETFLQAKKFSQLAPAAYKGPVVILNEESHQCDALVLKLADSHDKRVSVIHVPLRGFTSALSKKLFLDLKSVLAAGGVRDQTLRQSERVESPTGKDARFEEILRVLWLHVVKPVIDKLGYRKKSADLPRIWWCATGSLSFLPIHAAGLYGAGETGEKLSDYVISSYTPTLTAIIDQSPPISPENLQILAVAEPSKSNPIPKTENEVKQIKIIAGNLSVTSLMNEEATVERVLEGMKQSHWIHLACHGKQRRDDPMKSGFLLHGEKMLELSEIIEQTLPNADFAFLSACQTAMGDERIAQESAHLAAGMIFSGCRGVIATMWSIQDEDAPKITEEVYSRILKDGKPNREGAALALHDAVKRLREEPGSNFLSWVPFIHIGR